MSQNAIPLPVPTERIPAYDYAVQHGKATEAQYLGTGNLIMNHAPSDILIIGGGADTAYFHLCNERLKGARKGKGRTVVVETDPNLAQLLAGHVALDDPCFQVVAAKHEPPNEEGLAGFSLKTEACDAIMATPWEVIVVNPPRDKDKIKAVAAFVKRLRTDTNWIFFAAFESQTLATAVQEVLGQPKGVLKGFKGATQNLQAVWAQYGGKHRNPKNGEHY